MFIFHISISFSCRITGAAQVEEMIQRGKISAAVKNMKNVALSSLCNNSEELKDNSHPTLQFL